MLIQNNPSMFSFMIPSHFKEIIIRVYCKNKNNLEIIKKYYKYMLDIYNKNDESISVL